MVKLLPPVSEQEQPTSQVQPFPSSVQIKSQRALWHFLLCCKMSLQWKYFQITKTVRVKLFISLSTFALVTADSSAHLLVLVTSMSFLYFLLILPLLCLLTSLPPTTPPSNFLFHYCTHHHMVFQWLLSFLLFLLSLPHPPFSLFSVQAPLPSVFFFLLSSLHLLPSPLGFLFCLPSLPGPGAEWSHCCLSLSFSLSGQHFRDLLIGLELSIPSGWITEHRCKSPPV